MFISYLKMLFYWPNNIWTLHKVYVTYVCPKLEYNDPIWSPYLQKDIIAIEFVQKILPEKYVCVVTLVSRLVLIIWSS